MELKGIRDKLVHRGHDINIYTDRISFLLILMPSGEAELQLLHGGYKQEDYREDKPPRFKQYPLLPVLKRFTRNVLDLAEQVEKAIAVNENCTPSRKHGLNGVYIPALHHILSYEAPVEKPTSEEKRRFQIKAWYLLQAGDYLESLNFGYPDGFWLQFVVHVSELFGEKPPSYLSKPQYPRSRDSEILIEWQLIFTEGSKRFGLLLRDAICLEVEALTVLKAQVETFKHRFEIKTAALVLNSHVNADHQFAELIADTDPIKAAQRTFNLLTNST